MNLAKKAQSHKRLSIIVARKLLQDIGGGYIAGEITSAVDKITKIIQKHTSRPEIIDEVLSFHLIEYSPAPEEVFRAVLEASLKRRQLSFLYRSPAHKEKTERTVDPYHIFNYMGTWHLIAHCHMRKDIRDFNLKSFVKNL